MEYHYILPRMFVNLYKAENFVTVTYVCNMIIGTCLMALIVRGRLCLICKKKSLFWFCNCIIHHWCPRYTKKFC